MPGSTNPWATELKTRKTSRPSTGIAKANPRGEGETAAIDTAPPDHPKSPTRATARGGAEKTSRDRSAPPKAKPPPLQKAPSPPPDGTGSEEKQGAKKKKVTTKKKAKSGEEEKKKKNDDFSSSVKEQKVVSAAADKKGKNKVVKKQQEENIEKGDVQYSAARSQLKPAAQKAIIQKAELNSEETESPVDKLISQGKKKTNVAPNKEADAPLKKETIAPKKDSAIAPKSNAAPKKETISPKKETIPPKKDTSIAPKANVPSKKEANIPSKKETKKEEPTVTPAAAAVLEAEKKKDCSERRKKSQEAAKVQEYLLLNYPADIRRNLKGLKMPEEEVPNVIPPKKKPEPEKTKGEEWGDDEGEWEWEEDEEDEEAAAAVAAKESSSSNNKSLTNGFHTQNEADDEEEEDDDKPVDAKGAPDIKIQGSVLKIDRKDVVWSDDEYEESDEEEAIDGGGSVPPPPPPPPSKGNGVIPAPPPPPPGSKVNGTNGEAKPVNSKVEQLKKRPATRPDWKDLMEEIGSYKNSYGKLKKTRCNDRSKPVLCATKIGKSFIYDSEKDQENQDIMVEIKKGKRLRRVKTNDRSRPNLRGIRSFKRQLTKEERTINPNGFAFDENPMEADEDGDIDGIKDDLESTKQLLELEIRSKKLLERDNKKLQAEVEKMRQEFLKMSRGEEPNGEVMDAAATKARRDSVASKRQSMIRLISESESSANVNTLLSDAVAAEDEDDDEDTEEPRAPRPPPLPELAPYQRQAIPAFENEVIENMQEEVDEARKLAEEWENRYKEMQRQVNDIDMGKGGSGAGGKRMSITDIPPSLQRMVSSSSGTGGGADDDEEGEGWMLKRELHMLINKYGSIADKRDVVNRERTLLNERMETIIENIGKEVEARKKLRKEVNEMNEAFKDEIMGMARDELTTKELEECYFSDDELVENKFNRQSSKIDEDVDDYEYEDDEDESDNVEETLDDLIKLAEETEDGEEDPGHHLFEKYPETDDEDDEAGPQCGGDVEQQIDLVNGKIERHTEYLQQMRKSNFMMKSKIDRLFDILQMQREQHHDLKQELTRMLADIQ